MRYLTITLLSAILLLTNGESFAQVRKYSNDFLTIGSGARAMSMSGAVVASTDDVHSIFYNPAGLGNIEEKVQIGLMHSEHFGGIAKYDIGHGAFAINDKTTAGIGFIRLGIDDIPNTIFLFEPDGSINYDNISNFGVSDNALFLTLAHKFLDGKLDAGVNVKTIYRRVGSFADAWGFGLDIGAQYKIKQLKLGATFKDISGTYNAWSFSFSEEEEAVLAETNNEIPEQALEITAPRLILGAAYELLLFDDKFLIQPELNFELTADGRRNVLIQGNQVSADANFGLELGYKNIVFLRGGIGNVQNAIDENGEEVTSYRPNMGVGLKIKTFTLDYAFTDVGEQSGGLYSHVFSARIGLKKR